MAKGKYQKWLTPESLTLLGAWARDGLTDEQIAHNIGISRKTLAQWKTKYGYIGDALKKGKEVVDIEVENSLYKKATGYKTKETTQELVFDADVGKKVLATTKVVEKEVVPDTTAQIFWLKNRKPEQWREKQAEQHGINDEEDDNLYQAIDEAVKKNEV